MNNSYVLFILNYYILAKSMKTLHANACFYVCVHFYIYVEICVTNNNRNIYAAIKITIQLYCLYFFIISIYFDKLNLSIGTVAFN